MTWNDTTRQITVRVENSCSTTVWSVSTPITVMVNGRFNNGTTEGKVGYYSSTAGTVFGAFFEYIGTVTGQAAYLLSRISSFWFVVLYFYIIACTS